ncbi:MAG: site-2 protease family protein [Egibacteraceae bacterium]
MGKYLADSLVTVYPFTQQPDGADVAIANAANSVVLSVPAGALDILNSLAGGKTVGETRALYERLHDEKPDIEAFLEVMEREGFVTTSTDGDGEPARSALAVATPALPTSASWRRGHFTKITPETARRICSPAVLASCGLVIVLGLALIASDPSLLPSRTILVFPNHLTLLTLVVTVYVFCSIFLHELGHLVVARAAGVPSRLGLGHRLWALVAETEMTGIWMASKRHRYLAFLAGPLVDAVSTAILITLLWTDRQGWVSLPFTVALVIRACVFTYLIRLLWQCLFFVRTDFYYVIANAFNCKNLLADTEAFMRNQLARILPSIAKVDQSVIPLHEMRAIRWYSLIWLVGRATAFGGLFFITLPIFWGYGVRIAGAFLADRRSLYEVADALAFMMTEGTLLIAGMVLWIRGLLSAFKGGSDAMGTH